MDKYIKPVPKKLLMPLDIQFFAETKTDPTELDLKTLQTEFNASWKSLKTLLDQQADEMRTHGETYTKTADSITAIEKKIGEYEAELKGISDKYKELETKTNRPNLGGGQEIKTAGQMLVESD